MSRGWSGAAVGDGSVVLGSMDGRVVSVSAADGGREWSVPLQAAATGGGGFGCAGASAAPQVVIFGTPVVDGDIIYITGYNGKVYRVSATTRDSKDTSLPADNPAPKPLVGSSTVAGDSVYVGSSDGTLYVLDKVSLAEKWRFPTGDKIWSSPAAAGDTVYVTSFDKTIYALNASDGSRKWDYTTEGALVSSAVVDGNMVFFGSLDRSFYALDDDGNFKWKFTGGKWFWSTPVVSDGVVYAPNLDGKVYALDAASGQKVAEFDLGGPSSAAPVLAGDQLVVGTEAGKVFRIDTKAHTLDELLTLGQGEQVYAPLAADDGVVYVHSRAYNTDNRRIEGRLYAVNAQTGGAVWSPRWTSEPLPAKASGGTNVGLILAVGVGAIVLMLLLQTLFRRRRG